MIFPSFVILGTNVLGGDRFYLTCVPQGNNRQGNIEVNPMAEVPGLIARFVVEPVKDGSDHVHIRSCYKNKYLMCKNTIPRSTIVAGGAKPVNDKNAVDCTLFKVQDLGSQLMTLTHVKTGYGVTIDSNQDIVIGNSEISLHVERYDGLAKLPKRIMFKGDNERYLRCRRYAPSPQPKPGVWTAGPGQPREYENFNEFWSTNHYDRSSHYEITHYNGFIRIKSVGFDKFLRRSNDQDYDSWIVANSNDTTINNRDTLFRVTKFENDEIALSSIGNYKICRRLRNDGLNDCLKATETYVVSEAVMKVGEPLKSRKLEVGYRFNDAIITRKEPRKLPPIECKNPHNKTDVISDEFKYQEIRKTSWNSTTTFTNSVKAEVNIEAPKFVKGSFQLSSEKVDFTQLGKESTFSTERKVNYTVQVPPMNKATIRATVQEVAYDIPFSYIQTDVYHTGETVTITDENGVFQGFETYDVKYESDLEPL